MELSSEQRTVCLNLDVKSGLSGEERRISDYFKRQAQDGKEKC